LGLPVLRGYTNSGIALMRRSLQPARQVGRFSAGKVSIVEELQNIQTSRKLLSGKELVNKSKVL
jgi:hypothetical protein